MGDETRKNELRFFEKARPYLFVVPALLITIGILYPFATAIYYSFTNISFRRPNYSFVGLRNWINMFTRSEFWHSVFVTFEYALVVTVTEMLLGLGVAMLLYHSKGRIINILKVVLMFPFMVAPVVATLVWNLMTNNSIGILEKVLNVFGVYNFPWFASPSTALFAVALVDIWVNTPFVMILALAGLNSLPKSPFESAAIDGGSPWFNFKNLTLPMIKPYLLIALIFRLMAAMQEFTLIYSTTKGGPGNTLMNLSLTGYNTGFAFQRIGEAMSYLLVLWAIIYVISQKLVAYQQKVSKKD